LASQISASAAVESLRVSASIKAWAAASGVSKRKSATVLPTPPELKASRLVAADGSISKVMRDSPLGPSAVTRTLPLLPLPRKLKIVAPLLEKSINSYPAPGSASRKKRSRSSKLRPL
jgi:hypothetical protein